MDKTNAMRLLDAKKIPYTPFTYPPEITDGMLVAEQLGEDVRRVFKTLVTVSDKGEHFVFCVPVCASLDLKLAAKAAGAKSVAMIKQKELEPLTGYIHGVLARGHEKALPHLYRRKRAGLRGNLRQRGQGRASDAPLAAEPGGVRRREVRAACIGRTGIEKQR